MNKPAPTDKTVFGFWVYLMTDCVLFATLFATYAVLKNNTAGGPAGSEIFDLNFIFIETLLLLTSSFTVGMAVLYAKHKKLQASLFWLITTMLLGVGFVGMELYEFVKLATEGHGWRSSAFLSAYFTLVGTHGLHITIGLLWSLFLVLNIMKKGLTDIIIKRLVLFSVFWHFLDIVWIFIFTIVYLLGAIT